MTKLINENNRKWWVLGTVCFVLFMIVLDGNVVNLAIPKMLQDFHANLPQVEWVVNAYLLTFAIFLITFGRLGDMFGRRRILALGVVLFIGGSFACGRSGTIDQLIFFRVIQGLGGAMMMPATLSLISANFDQKVRGIALGIWGAVSGLALVAGPILGGYLTDRGLGSQVNNFLGIAEFWRYVFYINLPIGLLALVFIFLVIRESRDRLKQHRIDYLGILLSAAGVFALTFGFIEGQKYGWWRVNQIINLFGHQLSIGGLSIIPAIFLAALILLVLFVWHEGRVSVCPMMDLRLFRNRNFAVGNVAATIISFALFGSLFLLPLFLQGVLGYSAIETGKLILPLAITIMVAAPVAGRLSDWLGAKWLIVFGMVTLAIGGYYISHFSLSTTPQSLIGPYIVIGIGMGFSLAPSTTITLLEIPSEEYGGASGIFGTTRQLGSIMGIAILGAVLQTFLATNLTKNINNITGLTEATKTQIVGLIKSNEGNLAGGGNYQDQLKSSLSNLMKPSATPIPTTQILAQRAQLAKIGSDITTAAKQSFVDSINSTFKISAIIALFGSLIALLFRNRRPRSDRGVETAGI